jgi:hypothetical protein
MLNDGEPLIRGTVIADKMLENMSFAEIVSWLSCFTEPIKLDKLPEIKLSEELNNAVERSKIFAEHLDVHIFTDNVKVVLSWINNKNVSEIVSYIKPFQFGTFVKVILRLISMTEELKKLVHGISMYTIEKRLEIISDKLVSGIVTNKSLYI